MWGPPSVFVQRHGTVEDAVHLHHRANQPARELRGRVGQETSRPGDPALPPAGVELAVRRTPALTRGIVVPRKVRCGSKLPDPVRGLDREAVMQAAGERHHRLAQTVPETDQLLPPSPRDRPGAIFVGDRTHPPGARGYSADVRDHEVHRIDDKGRNRRRSPSSPPSATASVRPRSSTGPACPAGWCRASGGGSVCRGRRSARWPGGSRNSSAARSSKNGLPRSPHRRPRAQPTRYECPVSREPDCSSRGSRTRR